MVCLLTAGYRWAGPSAGLFSATISLALGGPDRNQRAIRAAATPVKLPGGLARHTAAGSRPPLLPLQPPGLQQGAHRGVLAAAGRPAGCSRRGERKLLFCTARLQVPPLWLSYLTWSCCHAKGSVTRKGAVGRRREDWTGRCRRATWLLNPTLEELQGPAFPPAHLPAYLPTVWAVWA